MLLCTLSAPQPAVLHNTLQSQSDKDYYCVVDFVQTTAIEGYSDITKEYIRVHRNIWLIIN